MITISPVGRLMLPLIYVQQINACYNTCHCCATHHVRGAGAALRVTGAVRRAPVGVVVGVPQVTLAAVPLVYHQVYRHLAFQT